MRYGSEGPDSKEDLVRLYQEAQGKTRFRVAFRGPSTTLQKTLHAFAGCPCVQNTPRVYINVPPWSEPQPRTHTKNGSCFLRSRHCKGGCVIETRAADCKRGIHKTE